MRTANCATASCTRPGVALEVVARIRHQAHRHMPDVLLSQPRPLRVILPPLPDVSPQELMVEVARDAGGLQRELMEDLVAASASRTPLAPRPAAVRAETALSST